MGALLRGALAGAAGTTALNAFTYGDMAVRGRPTSDAPQQVVRRSADRLDLDIPGRGDEQDNRVEGLAPLSGTAVGVVVGAVAGKVHHAFAKRGKRVPLLLESALIGAAAMAGSDVPLKVLGISDPSTWSGKDWASDIAPHFVFGLVTAAALRAQEDRA